jgi:hypothetical protein
MNKDLTGQESATRRGRGGGGNNKQREHDIVSTCKLKIMVREQTETRRLKYPWDNRHDV